MAVNALQKQLITGLHQIRPAILASALKKVLLPNRMICPTSQGKFWIDAASYLGYELFTKGIYEPSMVEVFKTYLKPGGVFVDLGANEGYFSVIAAQRVGTEGRVIAVEPQTRLQAVIAKNLALNACHNVKQLPIAISDQPQEITLHLSPDMNNGSTSMIQVTRYPVPKQKVVALTLTQVFEQQDIKTCDLLKIDIEGGEYEAILGSSELFQQQRIKAIALELHPHLLAQRGLSEQTIIDFLYRCGYVLNQHGENTVFVLPNS